MTRVAVVLWIMLLPLVYPVTGILSGSGVAGWGTEAQVAQLGARWSYNWSACDGRSRCLPMLRVGCPWCGSEPTVDWLMHTCGDRVCPGLMILNEPQAEAHGQDVCDWDCQVRQLHDHSIEARAINLNAVVVFGNWYLPTYQTLDSLEAAWDCLYADDFGTFLRAYAVRIGFHVYAWGDYNRDAWRSTVLDFAVLVKARYGVGVVLTEYGALGSGTLWKQVITDQAHWLIMESIPAAAFYGGSTDAYGCCAMALPEWGLTEYGRLYAEMIR